MSYRKLAIIAAIAIVIGLFFAFDAQQYLTLDYLQSRREAFQAFFADYPVLTLAVFFVVYVTVTALSLPGAAVMTLAAGALFQLPTGTLLVSFASTMGATLAFLVARVLFRDSVQQRFGQSLKRINDGVAKDGAFYLFGLRLVPVFPFFVINLVMALTPMRTWTFYWVSQVGMLPGTIVYVNAGTQLGQLESIGGLLSPGLIGSFVLLGLFPLIARKILQFVQARKVYRGWTKPDHFDRDLVVIGGGSAGLVSALIGATVKAKVTLAEKGRMGGDCLNTGCVPSKTFIRSARFVHQVNNAEKYGIKRADCEFDFAQIMDRVHGVIKHIEPHDSPERFRSMGVDVREAEAQIVSPWEVVIDGQRVTTRHIIVATGARPFVPPIPGLEDVRYYTTDDIWSLREQPEHLVVMGGGPIGTELTQAFARLGTRVTQLEAMDRIMGREDEAASQHVTERLAAEGVAVRTQTKAVGISESNGVKQIRVQTPQGEDTIECDTLLVAVGRKPNTEGFGLAELGVETTATGTIDVNEFLQTRYPNIYAVGDVAGPYQFTHAASHQAWHAAVNALFGTFKRFAVSYKALPWTTFTDPEVARVGLNEQEARAQGVPYEVTTYDLAELDRAVAEGSDEGFIRVLTAPGKDRILGATIVGEHAGELISEYVTAMRHGLGLNKILSTIHVYPTMAEANKFAASEWKKAHAPQGVLRWLERFHAWRRGDGFSANGADAARTDR
jgi:pyruvate/2-oxoglutarate dehydrogenase complex dihydrolipoamide dehydrogenase (E3) component/uncharacterized membrane protein YdjX (TVP38/TMEM64 family)